ncbi:MAG: FAD-linked oxidase C-terminal domain-containing protein [Bacteroidota bacterium]
MEQGMNWIKKWKELDDRLSGSIHGDALHQNLYATDASIYREYPLAVAFPKTVEDLQRLIQFANLHGTSLIPRTAGTSLAGQCVGNGIVVDLSRHFTKILEFNAEERWVIVQPGVIRDELNRFLEPHGLFFSPITSTANRAMIGGMVGNNSSGTNSIRYGVTRDKVLEMDVLLSDASLIHLKEISAEAWKKKAERPQLEGQIYRQLEQLRSDPAIRQALATEMPKARIHRRNTGYALDVLFQSDIINPCQLICGSEGTLALATSIKLHLDPLPPPENVVLAVHFHSIQESLKATQMAMQYQPHACELMDRIILECTKTSLEYRQHRFFVQGDPAAILLIEFRGDQLSTTQQEALHLAEALRKQGLGYHFPIIAGERSSFVWQLRSAGLGLLANIPGDAKAVACIEDTAVDLDDLPDYIAEFERLMQGFDQESVYYAHAGAGELHLRPLLNLKLQKDREQLALISAASAKLVKSFKGSLSGEHGDGRVRAPFLATMVGPTLYAAFRQIKNTWDPQNIFNPGKIVEAKPITDNLRYADLPMEKPIDTLFDFSSTQGLLRMAEKCNGSGDCRKLAESGGTMCPTFQATRLEQDSTRGRANLLREFWSRDPEVHGLDREVVKSALDLCISCKGCLRECPSNVDMSSLKAEFLHQHYEAFGIPLSTRLVANIGRVHRFAMKVPGVYNFFSRTEFFARPIKRMMRMSSNRELPVLASTSVRNWYRKNQALRPHSPSSTVYFFCDAFTNYQDAEIGIQALRLLFRLGYDVLLIQHPESGRAALSKGLLKHARKQAEANVETFSPLISEHRPLIGLEPSAILSFRDEYPRLVQDRLQSKAQDLSAHCLLIDEFLAREVRAGRIRSEQFTSEQLQLHFHAHCHQKALSDPSDTILLLSLPEHYHVSHIPSGCCGMAGSFGYEAEHYELSQQIGELVLFPAIRKAGEADQIVATGTSCRTQIKDGVARKALHPVEVLLAALLDASPEAKTTNNGNK